MKRVVFTIQVVAVICSISQAKYSGGSGTAGDPYQIATAADLLSLAANTGDYDSNFILTADIDLASYTFTTAVIAPGMVNWYAEFDNPTFNGVFDGAGHKIINLTINTNGAGNDCLGLFGGVSGGVIKNLGLENVSVVGGDGSNYIGGLVGGNGAAISNCYSTGNVSGGDNSNFLGGLVGTTGCYYSTVNITGTISNCYSTCNVTGGAGSTRLGGLVGGNGKTISNCYSTGNVTSGDASTYLGGLVGTNSVYYWTGAGWFPYTGTISNCYFLITSGQANGFGTPLTDAQMKLQSSFVGWDFSNIWKISEGIGYPELAWQSAPVAAPDLIITSSVGISPNPVTAGDNLTVTYTVKNNGSGNAAQSQTQIQVKLGSSTTTTTEISHTTPALDSGSSTTENVVVPIPSSVAAGAYTVYVLLNYNNAIGQSNVSNDTYQTSTGALTIQAARTPGIMVTVNAPYQWYMGSKYIVNVHVTTAEGWSGGKVKLTVTETREEVDADWDIHDNQYQDILAGWKQRPEADCNIYILDASGYQQVKTYICGTDSIDVDVNVAKGGAAECYFEAYHRWYWLPPWDLTRIPGIIDGIVISNPYVGVLGMVPDILQAISAPKEIRYTYTATCNSSEDSGSTVVQVPQDKYTLFVSYVGTDVAGAICFATSADLISLFLGAAVTAAGEALYTIASDPPDFNYTEVATPQVPDNIPELNQITDPNQYEAAEKALELAANVVALQTSLERYDAATIDGASEYAHLQWTAATNYAKEIRELSLWLSNFWGSISQTLPTPTPEDINNMRQNLLQNGLPDLEVAVLSAFGYSSEQMKIMARVAAYQPDELFTLYSTISDTLKTLANAAISIVASQISVTKCTVTAGSNVNSDTISFSGTMNATADDFNDANDSNDANFVEVTISDENSNDMDPCVITFPVNSKTWKKGKFGYSGTVNGVKKSFTYVVKTGKFAFAASNINLSGLECPVIININVGDFAGTAEVNEAIVNGKKSIPINLLMGVKDSLRVDKSKFIEKSGAITQVAISGGLSVEHPDVNMTNRVSEDLVVTLGTQTFTIPANNLKAGKGKFTCSKANVNEGGIATATFDFNKCTFTLTIKNVDITSSGTVDFCVQFAGFSECAPVVLP